MHGGSVDAGGCKVPSLYSVAGAGWPSFGLGAEGHGRLAGSFGRLSRDGCPCWSGSTRLTMGMWSRMSMVRS
jgi:hypothetical protein